MAQTKMIFIWAPGKRKRNLVRIADASAIRSFSRASYHYWITCPVRMDGQLRRIVAGRPPPGRFVLGQKIAGDHHRTGWTVGGQPEVERNVCVGIDQRLL